MPFINDDTMICVWLTLLVFLTLWFFVRYLYDTLFLEERYFICELLEKYEYRDVHVYDTQYYGLDGLYNPLWLFESTFFVEDEKCTKEVDFELFSKIKENDPIFVTYGTTRLSKKIKVKKIEAVK
jgi:hypothetical protein